MLIEIHDNLRNPERKEASRIVIYDKLGQPIATFMQLTDTNIDVQIRGITRGFDKALRYLGIQQTLVQTDVIKHSDLQ
jgi:hypothetical protein